MSHEILVTRGCPKCGYDLRATAVEQDGTFAGFYTCPECGTRHTETDLHRINREMITLRRLGVIAIGPGALALVISFCAWASARIGGARVEHFIAQASCFYIAVLIAAMVAHLAVLIGVGSNGVHASGRRIGAGVLLAMGVLAMLLWVTAVAAVLGFLVEIAIVGV